MDPDHEDRFDFDPLDVTKTWPEDIIPLQPVGRLVLNKNIDNFFRYRLGPNYLQLPANAPKCAHHNNHYDGSMNFMHRDEEIDYFPSCIIPEENNFKQPGERYRTFTPTGKNALFVGGWRPCLISCPLMRYAASGSLTGLRLRVFRKQPLYLLKGRVKGVAYLPTPRDPTCGNTFSFIDEISSLILSQEATAEQEKIVYGTVMLQRRLMCSAASACLGDESKMLLSGGNKGFHNFQAAIGKDIDVTLIAGATGELALEWEKEGRILMVVANFVKRANYPALLVTLLCNILQPRVVERHYLDLRKSLNNVGLHEYMLLILNLICLERDDSGAGLCMDLFWPAATGPVQANHGDDISIQYSGTPALKGDFVRYGHRTAQDSCDGCNASCDTT
ncbi:catalase A [Datura stramonium]|uniref:catalase n=1 Tax=Datura stramonium TaxID=4076 RepID=A0ABS8RRN0_DATST|nr:catalase A [Datura stramonium]